ncbi:uncharacterized protein [Linepithema humile]|uniref:uncharacterized protein n=1 Tax=Linepithema humile TaxID=83485 RepID=UPI00351EE3CB
MYMAFGAVLFIYITKSISIPPFDSFESLVTNTKYNVITMKGSSGEIGFKVITDKSFIRAKRERRLIVESKIEDMHRKVCSSLQRKKYAIFQSEDEYKVTGHIACNLNRTGRPYWKMWVASGIARNFKYKRSVDLGILKLMEVGLLDALKNRYLEPRIKQNYDDNLPKPIEIYQVSLVIAVICCGMIIAIIVFIIEKIIFVYIKPKQL